MKVINSVIDTNIIFSALLSHNNFIRDIIFDKSFSFFSPNYVFLELFQKKEKLLKYSKISEEEIVECFNMILDRITFIPVDNIKVSSRQEAYNLCKEIDLKDIPFLALSIEMNIPLWTGDKKLINHLLKKGFDNFLIYKTL